MSDETVIAEADRMHREANLSAMRSTGWRRNVHLRFAQFFGYVGSELRAIQEEKRRGKDDTYHDEY